LTKLGGAVLPGMPAARIVYTLSSMRSAGADGVCFSLSQASTPFLVHQGDLLDWW